MGTEVSPSSCITSQDRLSTHPRLRSTSGNHSSAWGTVQDIGNHNHYVCAGHQLGQAKLSIENVRRGRLKPSEKDQQFVSWNIEGLTEAKIVALQQFMKNNRVGIIGMQETHKLMSDYYESEEGFLIILSGSSEGSKECAGVGFMVAPWMRRSIISFCQASSRMASLKIRVRGGKLVLISCYAPHSGYPLIDRVNFFQSVAAFANKLSAHGPKLLLGDWNARLHRRLTGEEHILGPYLFSNPSLHIPQDSNRHLLIELCQSLKLVVANTLFDVTAEGQVTCYNVGHKPMEDITWRSHSQIDFLLCSKEWVTQLTSISSSRLCALASHHFPLFIRMQIDIPKGETKTAQMPRYSWAALEDHGVASQFVTSVDETMHQFTDGNETANLNLQYARLVDACMAAADKVLPISTIPPRHPWISQKTLALIEARALARMRSQFGIEQGLGKQIKASVKQDRSAWLDGLLASGDWNQIRKLRKGFSPKQGRL